MLDPQIETWTEKEAMEACGQRGRACRYSIYLLYWCKSTRYKSTNTDAAPAVVPQSVLVPGREEFKYTCIGSNTSRMCAALPAVATCKSSIICEAVSKSRMMQSRGL